jgi:protease secretion system membrane fusion protein
MNEHSYTRAAWISLAVGFGGFILWAGLAPLDKGVPAPAQVVSSGNRQVVQTATNGIVEEILVKDGDTVKEGQVLVKLNTVQTGSQVKMLEESIASKRRQVDLTRQQLEGLRELGRDQYISRNKLIDAERGYSQLVASLAEDQNRLQSMQFDLDKTSIKAPVAGTIANLELHTRGAVVQAGTNVLEVVPDTHDLTVVAHVPANMVDRVHTGLPVEILFPSLNQRNTPNIEGRVTVVPNDTSADKDGRGYYRVQVSLTDRGQRQLAGHEIRPGMPAEVFVVTGERTLLNYLFKPITDRAHSALREE